MLTDRCNFRLSKFLQEYRFPQRSIEFDSDYYTQSGELLCNVSDSAEKKDLIFAPYFCEVLDRFEIDLGLYLSVFYTTKGYQYRIYDPDNNKYEILSNLNGVDVSIRAYELCIEAAIKYYYNDYQEKTQITENI